MSGIFTSLVDFLSAHPSLAILMCFGVAFGEALLILGLFVPSTTVLVGAGTLVGLGELGFAPIFIATVLGAVAGDWLSFWVGWHYNDRLRAVWPFTRHAAVLAQGEAYFARHGGKSIFIVRFIPGAKAVVPAIAAMAGMPAVRFTLINVASAILWSAVHLLPAIALGRGIRVAHLADPRLLVLFAILALGLILVWYATRLTFAVLLPRIDRWRQAAIARLMAHDWGAAQLLARVLANHDGLFESFALLLAALLALRGFIYVLGSLLFEPGLMRSDASISAFAQTLRDEAVTRWMITLTMLGDGVVLVPVAVGLVVLFLVRRQWAVAGILSAATLASAGFVPLLKEIFQRARPTGLYAGTDAFSFPSGHSAHSTVVYGLLALMLARVVTPRFRLSVYLAATALIALIAFSRIYLLAHWPSDVLAGIFFGAMLVSAAAFALHGRAVTVPRRGVAALTVATLAVLWPVHIATGYSAALGFYAVSTPQTEMTADDWLADGWSRLPPARILLDGEYGEPMVLQSDLPLPELLAPFLAKGWAPANSRQIDALLGAILPTAEPLSHHSTWPLTNVGRAARATLARPLPGHPEIRDTLRIWDTETLVRDDTGAHPLFLASVTREALDPLMLGYSILEPVDLTPAETDAIRADLAVTLDAADSRASDAPDAPLLIAR